jgi:spore maturation protein CgeB
MAGWCPSGRLFEAAACGAPIISDNWPGLESFFEPDDEIIIATDSGGVVAALERSDHELISMALAARDRTLEEHSSSRRAAELIGYLEQATRHRRYTAIAAQGV